MGGQQLRCVPQTTQCAAVQWLHRSSGRRRPAPRPTHLAAVALEPAGALREQHPHHPGRVLEQPHQHRGRAVRHLRPTRGGAEPAVIYKTVTYIVLKRGSEPPLPDEHPAAFLTGLCCACGCARSLAATASSRSETGGHRALASLGATAASNAAIWVGPAAATARPAGLLLLLLLLPLPTSTSGDLRLALLGFDAGLVLGPVPPPLAAEAEAAATAAAAGRGQDSGGARAGARRCCDVDGRSRS